MKVVVEWSPRSGNKETDALVNGDAQDSGPEHDIKAGVAGMWDLLPEVLRLARLVDDGLRPQSEDVNWRTDRAADPW